MPDSTGTAVIAALAGGVGGFLGAALSAFLTHLGRREEHRRDQQRADAAVLGPVMTLLTDADPDRLAFNLHPEPAEQQKVMSALGDRVNDSYGALLILSAGHPSKRVSDLAQQLATATRNAFTSASWLIRDFTTNSDRSFYDRAKEDHQRARRLAEELLTQIARYGRG